jgi:hypothetical protein
MEQQPWIAFSAVSFLKQILTREMRVFEYGTGGSTLFFAKQVKEVVSVEHDKTWSEKVTLAMNNSGYGNWKLHMIEPTSKKLRLTNNPADPDAYTSSNKYFCDQSFENYVRCIDLYPDKYFDIILIDGRARPSCFKHAVAKIKYKGWIIWDNTDRKYYWPTMSSAPDNFCLRDFVGPAPYVKCFIRTSFWQLL